MFSGIIAEVGVVIARDAGRLGIGCTRAIARTQVGGSISVNGVCLTATRVLADGFEADVMPETFRRSGLGTLVEGAAVNLEPALAYGDEVGGHLVQGHVDGVGEVVEVSEEGNARWVRVHVPDDLRRYCVNKGGIAVDGTSLTIAGLRDGDILVSLIPHTLESTIASGYAPGSVVNLEVDILAKYVASFLEGR